MPDFVVVLFLKWRRRTLYIVIDCIAAILAIDENAACDGFSLLR